LEAFLVANLALLIVAYFGEGFFGFGGFLFVIRNVTGTSF
jgi:hypothetical protein